MIGAYARDDFLNVFLLVLGACFFSSEERFDISSANSCMISGDARLLV